MQTALPGMDEIEAMEFVRQMKSTKNNHDFFDMMRRVVSARRSRRPPEAPCEPGPFSFQFRARIVVFPAVGKCLAVSSGSG